MYKIIQQNIEDCQCHECVKARGTKHLREKVKNLTQTIGFTPYEFKQILNKNTSSEDALYRVIKLLENTTQKNEVFLRGIKTSRVVFCHNCGKAYKKQSGPKAFLENKSVNICNECLTNSTSFFECRDCNKHFHATYLHRVTGERVCHICFKEYAECGNCGDLHRASSIAPVVIKTYDNYIEEMICSTKQMCKKCSERTKTCKDCGATHTSTTQIKDNEFLCGSCKNLRKPVLDYSIKPPPVYKLAKYENKRKDTLFFGVEWEFENETDKPHDFYTNKFHKFFSERMFYVKKDSTIRSGVELVTYPFTWDRFKEDLPAWTNVFNIAAKHLLEKSSSPNWSNTCGIHIHTPKSAYTTAQLYKKIKFTYDKLNRDFIMGISGRERENEYFKFRKVDEDRVPKIAKNKLLQSGERHSAINLQPHKTVEDRIFASTVNASHFFKNIEFVHAVYYFSRDSSMKNLHWTNFLDYIAHKPKTYSNLHAYIKQRMNTKYAEYLTTKTGK